MVKRLPIPGDMSSFSAGNGIQQAFYRDPNVLYLSVHVHEDGNFYPPGPFGNHSHCGDGPGLGK